MKMILPLLGLTVVAVAVIAVTAVTTVVKTTRGLDFNFGDLTDDDLGWYTG